MTSARTSIALQWTLILFLVISGSDTEASGLSVNSSLLLGDLKKPLFIDSESQKEFIDSWQRISNLISTSIGHGPLPDDTYLTTPELIQKHGYPNETHRIVTEDGYILHFHRIPHGKEPPTPGYRRIPVYVQHGMFCESTSFLVQPEFNVLPYRLADAGYDVWMGNSRGSRYSRTHLNYTTKDWQYWLTEWHEMGLYDVSAGIDYILKTTGFKKLNYVAHSMGTTAFFALLATRPEYNDQVNYMIALAPPIFMTHSTSPVRALAPVMGTVGGLQASIAKHGNGEFFPHDIFNYLEHVYAPLCGISPAISPPCAAAYFAFVGFDFELLNVTHLPVMLGMAPGPTPTATMIHYWQEMNCISHCFRHIDRGAVENLAAYGSTSPPKYELSRLRVPKTFFYGDNDLLVARRDVELTRGLIPNTNYTRMSFPSWNHMDFLWAKNAHEVLHPQILSILKSYDRGFV